MLGDRLDAQDRPMSVNSLTPVTETGREADYPQLRLHQRRPAHPAVLDGKRRSSTRRISAPPRAANSPAKRIHFAVQLMYINEDPSHFSHQYPWNQASAVEVSGPGKPKRSKMIRTATLSTLLIAALTIFIGAYSLIPA